MKKIIRLVLLACTALVLTAPPALAGQLLTISNYSYSARVMENNVYEITETIDVRFDEPRHGIYRSIPTVVTTARESSGKIVRRKYRLSVRDVRVDGRPFTAKELNGWLTITVGDESGFVEGDQRYVLHYALDAGNDYIDGYDEVYLNVIGLDWYAQIQNADFTVELPKPFDASKVGAVAGGAGYANDGQVQWSVRGNTVSGSIASPLEPYEGVTLRVELPQGYFTGLPDPYAVDKALLAAILFSGAAGLTLLLLFGRGIRPVRPVEVGPPEGMTPAELGYVWDGRVSERDIVSMLFHWAGKGHLAIEKRKDRSFRLHWQKNLPESAKEFEKYLFGELFKNGTPVSAESLGENLSGALYGAATMVEEEFLRSGGAIYAPRVLKLKHRLAAAAFLPVTVALALAFHRVILGWPLSLFAAAVMGSLGFLPIYWLTRVLDKWKTYQHTTGTAKLVFCLALNALSTTAFLAYAMSIPVLPALPVAAAAVSAALAAFSVLFRRRTKQGSEWLGRALGFRDFIVKAEKDKLNAMVEQDPGYFYGILPYACVLGVTDQWARKFETLATRPPEWYTGYDRQFSPAAFARSAMEAMGEFEARMASAPSSGESGGTTAPSSGGAVAGGGIGGGGGGAW